MIRTEIKILQVRDKDYQAWCCRCQRFVSSRRSTNNIWRTQKEALQWAQHHLICHRRGDADPAWRLFIKSGHQLITEISDGDEKEILE